MAPPLWTPSAERIANSNMAEFMEAVEKDWNVTIESYNDLHNFSIQENEKFWQSLRDYAGLAASTWGDVVLEDGDKMPGAKFFPQAKLNFAENYLKRRDDGEAIIFWGEDKVRRRLTFNELYDTVSRLAQALRDMGVTTGDRVGAYMPNMPEAIIGMLATTSIGAIWSSCSPDFGVQGVVDRFAQIEPKVVISAEGYFYNGKSHDSLGKLKDILAQLPSVEKAIIVPYTREAPSLKDLPKAVMWEDFIGDIQPGNIVFEQLPFDHPVYILYSSGTTGVPKCIVHGAGGLLLQHAKEHILHCGIKPNDRVFYFTTCGWMMWNWLVSSLLAQATLLLYDGSPFYPDGNVTFDYAEQEKMTFFGTSAKFIDAVNKGGLEPGKNHDLSSVQTMASTGSPLSPESFRFVYDKIKSDIHLASISGGTDIAACFVLGNPLAPVYIGEIQARALAMDVDVFDDEGKSLHQEKGDLVCKKPFPSMPVKFWNDPDGAKYKSAYFEQFPNVWCHGDWVELTERGGMVIYGRSDATLNPGGVRIGTAEIYRQVESMDEVVEGIVIGQEWDHDTRVVLFVILREDITLDDNLIKKIQTRVRQNCTPRHVPAKVLQVMDIPRTKSGKITELAVRDVVHGRTIKNQEALANPEALAQFTGRSELEG
ncbi:MAG: acetoacetate--CoA ligase [Rhodospirillales bacterium]|nr:acetoacetate--CoA ligase [Rhodospirillales bacterium]